MVEKKMANKGSLFDKIFTVKIKNVRPKLDWEEISDLIARTQRDLEAINRYRVSGSISGQLSSAVAKVHLRNIPSVRQTESTPHDIRSVETALLLLKGGFLQIVSKGSMVSFQITENGRQFLTEYEELLEHSSSHRS
jgi:hypothetical protein